MREYPAELVGPVSAAQYLRCPRHVRAMQGILTASNDTEELTLSDVTTQDILDLPSGYTALFEPPKGQDAVRLPRC